VNALTANEGNYEGAFQELNKLQLQPFLMRVWGQADSSEVTSGAKEKDSVATAVLPNGEVLF
jgi:hypothetical protein